MPVPPRPCMCLSQACGTCSELAASSLDSEWHLFLQHAHCRFPFLTRPHSPHRCLQAHLDWPGTCVLSCHTLLSILCPSYTELLSVLPGTKAVSPVCLFLCLASSHLSLHTKAQSPCGNVCQVTAMDFLCASLWQSMHSE